jgi:predicted choloylglycine hydrolase
MPPELEVSGDYYEMGLQYGVLLRPEIYKVIDTWGNCITTNQRNMGGNPDRDMKYMYEPAQGMANLLPKRLIDEMKGIADGTGLPLETIIAYSLMYDVGKTWASTACGGVLLKGANGTVIHARVRDNGDGGSLEHAKYLCIIRHKPEGYNAVTEISWPGSIGGLYQGWNDKGITIAHNTLGVKNINSGGFPSGSITRIVLEESSSIAEAEKVLTTNLPVNGYCATVSDQRAGKGAVYELTSTAWAKRELKDNNPVWVFNDIRDPGLYPQQTPSRSMGFTPAWGDSNGDRWQVASTFKIKNEYTIDDAIDAMQLITGPDGSDYSWSGTREGISNWMTDVFVTYDTQGKGMYLGLSTSYASRKDIYYFDNDFSKQPTLYRKGTGVKQACQDYADIREKVTLDQEKLKDCVALASKYPDDPQAQFVVGYHAWLLKQPDAYAGYFEKAYSIKPDNAEYKLYAGLAALSSKNNDKSIRILEDIKDSDLYPAEELYRLTALQRAWQNKDQQKSDQYGQQIKAILDKYGSEKVYKSRIVPLINAFGSQN